MHKLISFVVSESRKLKKGAELAQKPLESAPQYYESSIPKQFAMEELKKQVGGKTVKFLIRAYPPENLLVEASVEVEDIFSEDSFKLREQLINACQEISVGKGGSIALSEEYSIALISGYKGDPDQFFDRKQQIASFLKSEKEALDEQEVDYTLSKQIKYAKDDLVIVDWDGAFVFDTKGQIDDIVDLFQTANLQLLRYRTLDQELDERLAKVTKFAQKAEATTKFLIRNRKELSKAFKEVIEVRAKAIADFEELDRDVKLIGDWYSARLYELTAKKFRMDEWREKIQTKLESLEDIYSIISENFSISRTHLLELLQIGFFFILQIGWLIIIVLEFIYFTSK